MDKMKNWKYIEYHGAYGLIMARARKNEGRVNIQMLQIGKVEFEDIAPIWNEHGQILNDFKISYKGII